MTVGTKTGARYYPATTEYVVLLKLLLCLSTLSGYKQTKQVSNEAGQGMLNLSHLVVFLYFSLFKYEVVVMNIISHTYYSSKT